MENHIPHVKEYNLLVYLPLGYGSEQAKVVREQWNQLLNEWKANGTYVTSYVYPGEGRVVNNNELSVQEQEITCGNFRLISNLIVKAPHYEAALKLAMRCPVLKQGANIEVREIQPRIQSPALNKEIVRRLYEDILNTGKLVELKEIISENYIGVRGEQGAKGFAETVSSIRAGFPDIVWTIEDLIAEDNKVVVRWHWKGTHTGFFRGFPPSNKVVTDNAIAIYEFADNKIVMARIQSEKLEFLQQIGIISPTIASPPSKKQ